MEDYREEYNKSDRYKTWKNRFDFIYIAFSILSSLLSFYKKDSYILIYFIGIILILLRTTIWFLKRKAKSFHKNGWRLQEKSLSEKCPDLIMYIQDSAKITRKFYASMEKKEELKFFWIAATIILLMLALIASGVDNGLLLKVIPVIFSINLIFDVFDESRAYKKAQESLADITDIIISKNSKLSQHMNSKNIDFHIYYLYCSSMELSLPLEKSIYEKMHSEN